MNDSDSVLVDALLGDKIIAALKLRGLQVQDICIRLCPGEVVCATVNAILNREQLKTLLEELSTPPENRR